PRGPREDPRAPRRRSAQAVRLPDPHRRRHAVAAPVPREVEGRVLTRAALFCLALLLASCRPPVPRPIAEELEKTPPGQTTVVFFTDFQCPFCRRTHAALEPLVAEREGRVRVVLKHVPLRRHPDARTAARAAICVERLTPPLLADYAHALFEAHDLSEAACEAMAVERGVDRDALQRCLS